MMHFDNLEYLGSPRPAEETYEDEVCHELCLQLAENLVDLGACEFSREVKTEGTRWLVTARRA